MPYSHRACTAFMFALAVAAAWPGIARAQDWAPYENRDYRFTAIFPGEPAARDFDYETANGFSVPARAFSAMRGEGHYSVTVVDYSSQPGEADGAVAHAAEMLRQRGMVRYDEFSQLNGIAGQAVSVVEPDGRQILATVYFHDNRLYITEGSEAAGRPPANHFTMSLDIIDADGNGVNLLPEGATTWAELLEILERQREEAERQGAPPTP